MPSNALPSSTIIDTLSSTQSESKSVETEANSIDINEDEKEKKIRLEAKRESLINSTKNKWFNNPYFSYKDLESVLIEKLLKIEQLEIIEELEKEIHKAFNPNQFEKKLDELLAASSSQQNNE
ncbi:hypothetical protein QQ056_03640 [Oscillatoria laete-virens NRMC-F 0139]|nr:hypothetical protein [Oscillatoria laete-virens]MDL5052654.1 hypothetical protein [Oscillatoria laete-virens NRMC-F 0139]